VATLNHEHCYSCEEQIIGSYSSIDGESRCQSCALLLSQNISNPLANQPENLTTRCIRQIMLQKGSVLKKK